MQSSIEPVIAASDVVVMRALERAGARLLSAANAQKVRHPLRNLAPSERHTWKGTLEVLSTSQLLEGCLDYASEVAARYGLNEGHLKAALDGYLSDLIENGERHDFRRLGEAVAGRLAHPATAN